jgi:hypothetical protein
MANGDDAALAGMDVVPSIALVKDGFSDINLSRDYTANGSTYWMPGVTLPIERGGHGASTAAGARTALVVPESAGPNNPAPGKAPVYNDFGRIAAQDGVNPLELVNKRQLDAHLFAVQQLIDALVDRVAALEAKP